ncbi:MAG: FAD-dependent monooxygenase [Aliihoeflea sp.]
MTAEADKVKRIQETEIVIIGGGPVGMGLAIELGQRGISTIVVEQHEPLQKVPKGQNLTQRTMEHFHFWGAEKQLRAARTIPPQYGIGGLTAYGTLTSGYHYDWFRRELVRPFYFKDNERLPQYATERVMRERVAELPSVKVLYGWTGSAVRQDEAGVCVTATGERNEADIEIRAAYAVGCDGSRSVVRGQAGIGETRSRHNKKMVLLVFRAPQLHALLERFPGKQFYNVLHPDLDGYWQFFGRVDLEGSFFFHAPVPDETTRDNFDFAACLHRAAGAEFDVEFEHIGFWDLRVAIANDYEKGRVFIAGDAAHSHPPYGGYGINTGFEDAHNLGWKLAAVLRGWGGPKLLASYGQERRPVFVSTARDFIEKAIETDRSFVNSFNPNRDRTAFETAWRQRTESASVEIDLFEPHYAGSPIVFGDDGATSGAVGGHTYRARAGHHLAPRGLSSGINVFEALGEGFTLLALDGDATTVAAFRDAAAKMRMPLEILEDSRTEERELYEARYILVRPDQFVAWVADDDPGDPATILMRAIGG